MDNVALLEKVARDLRREGVEVRFVSGWRSRGRDGTFEPEGVLSHHTASSRLGGANPALGICTHGRADLPGPLCQIHLARPTKLSKKRRDKGVRYGSVVTVIAAGRANHAGLGGPWRWIAASNGNAEAYGIEVENDGVGEPWPSDQLAVNALLVAYLLYYLEGSAWFSGDHREYTSRKIDRANLSSGAFRRRVRKNLRWIKREKKGRR
jgi:hypothetical protein